MDLKQQNPLYYDHTDQKVVHISEFRLRDLLRRVSRLSGLENRAFSLLGTSLAFTVPAALSDSFIPLGQVPGESLRVLFLFLGIASFVWCLATIFQMRHSKKDANPDAAVDKLLDEEHQSPRIVPPQTRISASKKAGVS